jgi:hypothetical protein
MILSFIFLVLAHLSEGAVAKTEYMMILGPAHFFGALTVIDLFGSFRASFATISWFFALICVAERHVSPYVLLFTIDSMIILSRFAFNKTAIKKKVREKVSKRRPSQLKQQASA